MVGGSLLRYIRNVLEKTLPEGDFDREYFELLVQSGNADGSDYDDHDAGDAQETSNMEAAEGRQPAAPGADIKENSGYIHTHRGVRVSFADINHIVTRAAWPDQHRPRPGEDDHILDLSKYSHTQSSEEGLSPHVLDLHS